jgi:hypothetical protein
VDAAITKEQIDRSLPFIRKKGIELLRATYPSEAEAHAQIQSGLREFYRKEHPEALSQQGAQVDAAARALQDIYSRNVFPKMNVTWGTYPNNLGHQNFPGCYRCHDDNHKSQTGKTITQDCSACHDLLAMDEEKPQLIPEILQSQASGSKP